MGRQVARKIGGLRGRAWLVACAIAACGVPSAHGDAVRLRRTAEIVPGAAIALQDVAELDGAYAQSLRDVVVVAPEALRDNSTWVTVDLAQVRAALEAQGVRLGALVVSGRSCMVRMGPAAVLPQGAPIESPQAAWEEYVVADAIGAGDVVSLIVAHLAQTQGLSSEDRLRIRFDDALEKALAVVNGARMGVEARSAVSAGAALFGLTAYDAEGGIHGTWTVRVEAQVWRSAVRMVRTVNRRGTIAAGDVTIAIEWINLGEAAMDDVGPVIGAEARVRLAAGELVREGQLQPPLAIRRGDLVQVHCLSGGLVVRGRGRAMAPGRLGELIECKLEGAERSFLARVDGTGRVVMEAVAAGEPVAEVQ